MEAAAGLWGPRQSMAPMLVSSSQNLIPQSPFTTTALRLLLVIGVQKVIGYHQGCKLCA